MNHFRASATATSMATTLANIGRQRPLQDVRIVCRDTLHGITFYHVQVNGAPERYRVSERFLQLLQAGQTPEYLELQDDPIPDDLPLEYPADDRACSAADRDYQERREI